jgi:hypothetical protein
MAFVEGFGESAGTDHDHINRCQDQEENAPRLARELNPRRVRHCIAQHFQMLCYAVPSFPGDRFSCKLVVIFLSILALVYMVMVCVCILFKDMQCGAASSANQQGDP